MEKLGSLVILTEYIVLQDRGHQAPLPDKDRNKLPTVSIQSLIALNKISETENTDSRIKPLISTYELKPKIPV